MKNTNHAAEEKGDEIVLISECRNCGYKNEYEIPIDISYDSHCIKCEEYCAEEIVSWRYKKQ